MAAALPEKTEGVLLMKRLISLLLCLLLIHAAAPGAFALEYKLSTTLEFLELIEERDYVFSDREDSSFPGETLGLHFDPDDVYTAQFFWFFEDDESRVTILSKDLIEYDESMYDELLEELNALNEEYYFVRWVAHRGYVFAQMDLMVRESDELDKLFGEALDRFSNILDETQLRLLPYALKD